jgi:hypothetical protein
LLSLLYLSNLARDCPAEKLKMATITESASFDQPAEVASKVLRRAQVSKVLG